MDGADVRSRWVKPALGEAGGEVCVGEAGRLAG